MEGAVRIWKKPGKEIARVGGFGQGLRRDVGEACDVRWGFCDGSRVTFLRVSLI